MNNLSNKLVSEFASYRADLNNLHPLASFKGLKMHESDGLGHPLIRIDDSEFGADLIKFDPGKGVKAHRHQGDHILVVLHGEGVLILDGDKIKLSPGVIYGVPSASVHAIQADSELSLISIGNKHVDVACKKRLEVVDKY